MRVDPYPPKQAPGASIERIEPAGLVAEKNRRSPVILDRCAITRSDALASSSYEGCRTHGPVCLECPVQAAAFGIDRVNYSAGAASEQHTVLNGGRRERRDIALEPEGPLECEVANLRDAECCAFLRLETCIRRINAPSGPLRRVVPGLPARWRGRRQPALPRLLRGAVILSAARARPPAPAPPAPRRDRRP